MSHRKRKIILKQNQSPGDIMMLTAVVRDLKNAYPNWEIDVRTSSNEIWDNNHRLSKLNEEESGVEIIECTYPLINDSNYLPYHFIHSFRLFLEQRLGVAIPQGPFKGEIFISDREKSWMSQIEELGVRDKFWIIMAGGKWDFTAKWWDPNEYQKVVDHFKNKITFVQCGEKDHFHPHLKNVINLVGKTNLRQFIRLMYHSIGVVCPVTFAMHLSAAVECRYGLYYRPTVVLAGGREPEHWESYPGHRHLSLVGALPCCAKGGCWRSRCTKVGDKDEKDDKNLCELPVEIDFVAKTPYEETPKKISIPKCMKMISAEDVIKAIESYYTGGVLNY